MSDNWTHRRGAPHGNVSENQALCLLARHTHACVRGSWPFTRQQCARYPDEDFFEYVLSVIDWQSLP